jgi:hypothetical protein
MQTENSDSRLAVRFYQRPVENNYLTTQEGRPVVEMKDFVRIEVPGDMTTIIDTFVNDDHKKRFPIQWAQFMNDKDAEAQFQGTLLRDWSLLNAAQAEQLKHYKFYTVEQVASASDQQIATIGMMLGISPATFRDKAIAYLQAAKDSSLAVRQAEQLAIQAQEIADLRAQIEQLAQAGEKRGPGRPRKET